MHDCRHHELIDETAKKRIGQLKTLL